MTFDEETARILNSSSKNAIDPHKIGLEAANLWYETIEELEKRIRGVEKTMKMTYWINKELKGEKCFVEEFDNKHDLLAPIYGVDKVERCFYLGKKYDTEFDMHIYVLNKEELRHALEYLDVLVSDTKARKMTGLWYDLNRELYDDGFKVLIIAFEYE